MRRHAVIMITAAFLTSVCAMPTFAHCHGGSYGCQVHEFVCESSCEDGFQCGVDGHYCSEHRESEACEACVECEPIRRQNYHHHRRH